MTIPSGRPAMDHEGPGGLVLPEAKRSLRRVDVAAPFVFLASDFLLTGVSLGAQLQTESARRFFLCSNLLLRWSHECHVLEG